MTGTGTVFIDPERHARITLRLLWAILGVTLMAGVTAGVAWGTLSQRVQHLEDAVYGRTIQQFPAPSPTR